MTISISVAAKNAVCDALLDRIDLGSHPTNPSGRIDFYTGTRPTTPATATAETLLTSLPFTAPAFNSAVNGIASANLAGGTPPNIVSAGTVGWFRITNRTGDGLFDGVANTSNGDIVFDGINWTMPAKASLASFSIGVP